MVIHTRWGDWTDEQRAEFRKCYEAAVNTVPSPESFKFQDTECDTRFAFYLIQFFDYEEERNGSAK